MNFGRTILVLAGLLFVWPLLSEAAELKGFGPIAFGMTKAEAIAALGGQVSADNGDSIEYSHVIGGNSASSDPGGTFRVTQYFTDGRAANIVISYDSALRHVSRLACVSSADRFASMVMATYGEKPIVQKILSKNMFASPVEEPYLLSIYTYSFEKFATILIENLITSSGVCGIFFYYHPPKTNPIPF